MRREAFIAIATIPGRVSLHRPISLEALVLASRFRMEGEASFGTPLGCLASHGGVALCSASFVLAAGIGGALGRSTEMRVRSLNLRTRDAELFPIPPGARPRDVQIQKMDPIRADFRPMPVLRGVHGLAWRAVGDPDACLRYLNEVTAIGTRSGQGWGEVARWTVEEPAERIRDEVGFAWFQDGRPIRQLPEATVLSRLGTVPDDLRRGVGRVAPPFWATDDAVPTVEPYLDAMTVSRHAFESELA